MSQILYGFHKMTGTESEPADEKTTDQPVAKDEAEKKDPEASLSDQHLSDSKPKAENKSDSAELKSECQSKEESKPDESIQAGEAQSTAASDSSLPKEEAELQSEEKAENNGQSTPNADENKTDSAADAKWAETGASPETAPKAESAESEDGKPPASESEKSQASSLTLTQHHVSHLLSDVLDDNEAETSVIKGIRFPMIFDCLLGLGLLVAVGGFTIGLFQMYLVHSASQCISEQRYKAAITILKGAPMPQVFARAGSDTEELLSKARYLDAMDKLESGTELETAIKELGEIHPGSKYFALAQEAINENTEPASVMLQGGAETTETAPVEEKQSLLDKTLKEEEKK